MRIFKMNPIRQAALIVVKDYKYKEIALSKHTGYMLEELFKSFLNKYEEYLNKDYELLKELILNGRESEAKSLLNEIKDKAYNKGFDDCYKP